MGKKVKNIRPEMDIAVVGMAGKFPGAKNIDEYWENLKNGVESIHFFSDEELIEAGVDPAIINMPGYVRGKGVLEDIEYFDASFFNYSSREAKMMDPQTRIFHQCIWEAIENAGYNPETYKGLIGLYAGASPNVPWEVMTFMQQAKDDSLDNFTVAIRNNKDLMNTQISYNLNLKGPSLSVYSACSTSLVAIHQACQGLLSGDCDIALAGGVSIEIPQKEGYIYQEGMIKSSDGHCRAFDGNATGTVYGSGVGAVVLKRIEDAIEDNDYIYAIIKGSAVNNDGKRKVGYTAPSIDGQSEAIKMALKLSEIGPEEVCYIETHGTGTAIGDPIEIEALKKAFNSEKKSFCGVGSVKPNIGHLDAAAGVASFIKAVLILKNRVIPPHLNYKNPNLKIDFVDSPFYVNTEARRLEENSNYYVGVSSFGLGGTNCHIVLQDDVEENIADEGREWRILTFSARTESALKQKIKQFGEYLNKNKEVNFADVAYTLQVGRKTFKYKQGLIGRDVKEILSNLIHLEECVASNRIKPVLLLTGEECDYSGLGYGLYKKEVVFKNEVDKCLHALKCIVGYNISAEDLFLNSKEVNLPKQKKTIYLIFQYALCKLLIKWGVKPYQIIYSEIGELTADVLYDKLSLENALRKINEETIEDYYTEDIFDKIKDLYEKEDIVFIQIGCDGHLSNITNELVGLNNYRLINILKDCKKQEDEQEALLKNLVDLWKIGNLIAWTNFYENEERQRIPLPTYPFETKYFWIEGVSFKDVLIHANNITKLVENKDLSQKNPISKWFYIPLWEQAKLKTQVSKGMKKDTYLMFAGEDSMSCQLIKSLEEDGHHIIVVKKGSTYCKKNENRYRINPREESDYDRLLKDIIAIGNMPKNIIHSWLLEDKYNITQLYQYGFYSLIFLAKAISKSGIFENLRINLISKDMNYITGKENILPEKMLALAVCKVLPQEYSNILCHCIDISDYEKKDEGKLKRYLINELGNKSTGQIIAYRSNGRFIKNYKRMQKDLLKLEAEFNTDKAITPLKEKGTYLITGGLGGIGLILAEYLAKSVKAKLVLLSRTGLPEREHWKAYIVKNPNDVIAQKIQKVLELESFGAEVNVVKADVSHEEEMREVILNAKQQFGKINGVIHAAGIVRVKSGQTPIEKISKVECEEQFLPKVTGTQVLQKVLEHEKIDFCMLVSSLAPILGGLGHVAYAAANLYMDAFVEKMGESTDSNWISVNWAEWQNTIKHEQRYATGEGLEKLELTPKEGISVFQQVLMMEGINRVVISTGDLQSRIDQWIQLSSFNEQDEDGKQESLHSNTYLNLSSVTEIEKVITDIWLRFYGIEEVSKEDNFFELGATSLDFIHINSKLGKVLKRHIPLEALFEYPTIKLLSGYLAGDEEIVNEDIQEERKTREFVSQDIAVIGMACRLPGANNIDEYWENLVKGVESVTFFEDEELMGLEIEQGIISEPNYIKAKGYIPDAEFFDAEFFNYSEGDAQIMDPQIRVFQECVWTALEDAGYTPDTYDGLIGLFAGATPNLYWEVLGQLSRKYDSAGQFESALLYDKDSLTTQTSYKLNLRGPSTTIFTGCSTSLVAVDYACESLLSGKCDMAIAGGVTVTLPIKTGYLYQEGMIFSKDGHVKSFDADANGIVFSDGAGAVILKPLDEAIKDGDHVYAVIKGSAVNNDGNRKAGYSSPSIRGQSEVIRRAQKAAGVSAKSISYIEAHGTATRLGDPIEFKALKQAFNTEKKGFCRIGSVKSNIGHTMCASGIAGLIKTALSLQNKLIPPSLNYTKANPEIDFANSPFVVNTQLNEWKHEGYPLRAGISSFGIGGTNAHIVMEEPPIIKSSTRKRHWKMLLLSARTEKALEQMTENLSIYLENHPEVNLEDVAYTLQTGKTLFKYRRTMVCEEVSDAIVCLKQKQRSKVKTFCINEDKKALVYMFSGQGGQYVNMGEELYRMEPVFRDAIDQCAKIFNPLIGYNVKDILYPEDIMHEVAQQKINQTRFTQPVLFSFEYALAKLLMSWGLNPSAMIGYSFGEYVAAHLAGVMSLEDILKLIVLRGELMQSLPEGMMLSVPLCENEVIALIEKFEANSQGGHKISIAIINGPSCIVAGTMECVEKFEAYLKGNRYMSMRIATSYAVHSPEMEPIAEKIRDCVSQIKLEKPTIPYISGLTGTWITDKQATDAGYWSRHIMECIHFSDGIDNLMKESNTIFIEIGPGRDLSVLLSRFFENQLERIVNIVRPSYSEQSDLYFLMTKANHLWAQGIKIGWVGFYMDEKRKKLSLPSYPFERKRYLIEGNPYDMISTSGSGCSMKSRTTIDNCFYSPQWIRSNTVNPVTYEGARSTWLMFKDELGITSEIIERLITIGHQVVSVETASVFEMITQNKFKIDPCVKEHYDLLVEALQKNHMIPDKIVHSFGIIETDLIEETKESFRQIQEILYYSVINLVKALNKIDSTRKIELNVITDNMQEITGEEEVNAAKSTVLGATLVIPQEYDYIYTRSIDIILQQKSSDWKSKLVKQLLDELLVEPNQRLIAFRGGYRWAKDYVPMKLPTTEGRGALREEGVYLITGGLGGIGLIIAKYLAESLKAKLILIGRTLIPPNEEWEAWHSINGENHPLSRKIKKLLELEELGAKVLVYSVDVADEDRMYKVIQEAEDAFGSINGVIHSAGILEGQSFNIIRDIKREDCELQFQSKVYGLMNLEKLLRHKKLDFCMIMSSIASVLGGLGFISYSAANIYLDSFVHKHNKKGETQWISVNWSEWKYEKHIESQFGKSLADFAMSPKEGIEAVERILAARIGGQVTSSSGDLEGRIQKWVYRGNENVVNGSEDNNVSTYHKRPNLTSEHIAPRNPIEEELVEIWQDIFRVNGIGVQDDFFEYGGDSLKAITLISRIHKLLSVEIPVVEFFKNATIEKLAVFVEKTTKSLYETIKPVEKRQYYPVSPAQNRVYIIRQMEGEQVSYNTPVAITIKGNPNIEKIEKSFRKIIARHETLRTSFKFIDGKLIQYVHDEAEFNLTYVDISDNLLKQTNKALKQILKDFIKPFKLEQAPLIRGQLVKLSDEEHLLMYDLHHIISDGVSANIVVTELISLYTENELQALNLQYRDFSEWQNSLFQMEGFKKQEKYWLNKLSGEIPVLNMPTDYLRPQIRSFEGDTIIFEANEILAQQLNKLAADTKSTLYIVLLTGYNILLSKYTGQHDILIGLSTAGRPHIDFENIIGMFVNTVIMRNYPKGNKTFISLLEEVKQTAFEAYENQDYHFDDLVEKLKLHRDLSRTPLFDTMFTLQNPEIAEVNIEGLKINSFDFETTIAKFDLNLNAWEVDGKIKFMMEYSKALFKNDTIQNMVERFINILQEATDNPEMLVSQFENQSAEKINVLFGFNDDLENE